MIRKAADIKLKVLPVFAHAEHLYYYEGPCRMGSGETLQPGYDALVAEQMLVELTDKLKSIIPEGVEVLEPVEIMRTDDWDNHEAMYEAAAPAVAEADVLFTYNRIASDDIMEEFIERFHKPVVICPITGFSLTIHYASLKVKDETISVYSPITWADVTRRLAAMRAAKVIHETRILCANRFGSTTSFSSVDAFHSHDEVTRRLGVRFRFVNVHELMDQMSLAEPKGNHTTPGRKTWDLTEAELAEIAVKAREMADGADNVYMPIENIENSLKAFYVVRKLMDFKDCNGFTAPCPDACSTRRLHEQRFTFCLTHTLNMEDGIPSSCEYDTDSVLSQQALIAVSGKTPYMGNTTAIPYEDGKLIPRFAMTEEEIDKLMAGDPTNLYFMQHSVSARTLRDPKVRAHYDIRPFGLENQFGVTLKYDFDQDAGQKITCCRFSPDGSKLFIGQGEIVCGGGFHRGNCTTAVFFRVADQEDFFRKQCLVGNHVTMVYGDYKQALIDLADVLGVEAVVAK